MKPQRSLQPQLASIFVLIGMILLTVVVFYTHNPKQKAIREFESFLRKEYKNVPVLNPKEAPEMAVDQPDAAKLQDYFMTVDPATRTIPRARLLQAFRQTQMMQSLKSDDAPIQWTGYPADMGGRTRTLMYDPNDATHKKVWAGSVTGGLWYNNNIQDPNSSWIPVGDFLTCLAIRCITYDPANPMTFYLGTGEVETARQTYRESSGVGDGIWKSTDGGQTWNQLPATTSFDYVTDILVRNESGTSVIYAGVASGLYHGENFQSEPSDGLFRSTNGGTTWSQVLPNISGLAVPYPVSDIETSADGARIFVGTRPNLNGDGGATILYSDQGVEGSWVPYDYWESQIKSEPLYNIPGRVVLAKAPSDAQIVYAQLASGFVNPNRYNFEDYYCRHMLKTSDKGDNWTRIGTPYNWSPNVDTNFANLAWHALDMAVDPSNPNTLYIGGLDVFKTTDGGDNWTHLTDWAAMYWGGGSNYVHADQHVILYKPGSSSEILFASDGGVFYTANGTALQPTFEERNHDYNTLQLYSCAIKPTAGVNHFLGGLQDNGSLRYTGNPLWLNDMVSGGDGAYAFYDKNEANKSLSTIYYNYIYVFNYDNLVQGITNWYPSGVFVNPMDYDYKNNTLFANACSFTGTNVDYLLKINNLTGSYSGTFLSMNTGTQVYFSAVRYSPYSPTNKTNLFIGTQAGQLFKVTNAEATPSTTEITGSNFPISNISCIALGGSEDTLLVTFSNYGVVSVWQSYNGGQTWQNREGNLPDMPIRWALYHPKNYKQALLATETGVWQCINLDEENPTWQPVNDGMANVRVDMLDYREADKTVLAGTHGRGFFTTAWDVVLGQPEKAKSNIVLYPNPTSGTIHLEMNGKQGGTFTVDIFDQSGNKVMANLTTSSTGTIQVDLLSAGIYFAQIKGIGNPASTIKFIKMD